MKSRLNLRRIALGLIGALAVTSGAYLIAADHIDAPAVTGKSSDITDFYAFQSPSNSANIVFVVNTQGLLAPSATSAATFDSNVMLEVNIDNSTNKDGIEDLVLQVTFLNGKVQVYGPVAPTQTGLSSTLMSGSRKVEGSISTYGGAPSIGNSNNVQVFAGPRDDPFFFDLDQYKKVIAGTATGFNNPGVDTFKGTNVMSVVIELPKTMLGSSTTVNTWATSNRKI
ncbi:MAG: DUF4331 family protein [Cyclobacteriaceae bacterium]|nr:DUF4331 family protein [Cyclobacteriaceae bacterium]